MSGNYAILGSQERNEIYSVRVGRANGTFIESEINRKCGKCGNVHLNRSIKTKCRIHSTEHRSRMATIAWSINSNRK